MKHSFIILVFRAYALTVQLAISMALARIFAAQGYGRWGLMLGLAQWGYTFFLAWNTMPLTRFGREEFLLDGTLRATHTSRMVLLLPGLLLLMLTAMLFAGPIGRATFSPEAIVILIVGYSMAFLLSETVQYILPAIGRADLTAPILGLERTLLLGILAFLYRYELLNPPAALVAFASSSLIVNLSVLFLIRSLLKPWQWNPAHLQRYWRFSRPILFSASFGGIAGWIDLFIINHFGRLDEVGRYFIAYQILNALSQVGLIISLISGPFMVLMVLRRRNDLTDLLANRLSWFALWLGVGLVFLMTPAVWLAFHLVRSGAVSSMMLYWLLLAPAAAFSFMSLLSANYYMSKEAILPLTFITGIGMAVNVLLDLILIPVHGPTGAALATTAGQIAVFVTCSLHQKKFGLHARLIWLKIPIAFLPTIIFIPLISSGPFVILALGLLGGLPVMAWVVWETFSLLRHQTKFESPPPVESS